MKKIYSLLLLLLTMAAAHANPITRAEARLVANELVTINDHTNDAQAPWAPYYIFSRGEGKGFVIVSGDDDVAPIIGYTDSGDFNPQTLPTPLQEMLSSWAEKVNALQQMNRPAKPRRMAKARMAQARHGVDGFKANWQEVPVLCQTHWNQGGPYNDLCPTKNGQRALTGCVATAASQIVYYFRRDNPDTLLYATPTYESNWGDSYGNYPVTVSLPAGTPVEYNLMKLSGRGTAAQDHAVAVLMYAVGTCSYLNYGPSTAGQPDEAGRALSNQFHLDSDYHGKWDYSQAGWELLIYQSLRKGSPMLYGGTHPTNGGHAVVLDGYQAATGLFHFNFGWGGQGDGYFTVDDETGMNGFKSDQRGCLNFRPRKQNLSATAEDITLYRGMNNTVAVEVTNNGTLDYQGISVWFNSRDKLPAKASFTDENTIIQAGKKVTIDANLIPSGQGTGHLFVTDANGNIILHQEYNVETPVAMLTVKDMQVEAAAATEELDDINFARVNNTSVQVTATIVNDAEATPCEPKISGTVYIYNKDTHEWTRKTGITAGDVRFEPGDTCRMTFSVNRLEADAYYRFQLEEQVRIGSVRSNPLTIDTDNELFFTTREGSLQVTFANNRNAVVTGRWNQLLFNEQMGDSAVCVYDMTAVEDLSQQPVAANPNALFVSNEPIADSKNVIVNGVCENLVVSSSAPFCAPSPFTAVKAQFVMENAEPGRWTNVILPFKAPVDEAMQVNYISAVEGNNLTFEYITDSVPALTPVLVLPAREEALRFEASNVAVTADSVATACDGLFKASTVGFTPEADARYSVLTVVGADRPVYTAVEAGTPVAPFTVALFKTTSSGIRANDGNNDSFYRQLADSIASAYTLLDKRAPYASSDALTSFTAAITTAQSFFSGRQGESTQDIKDAIATLAEAMEAFANTANAIQSVAARPTSNGAVEYYNLAGQRIPRPTHGIVIVRKGNSVRKMMVR